VDRQHKFPLSSVCFFSRAAAVSYFVFYFTHLLQFPSKFYNTKFISSIFHNSGHLFLNIFTTVSWKIFLFILF